MQIKVQLVIDPDNTGSPITTEVAQIERDSLDSGNVGLHLAEAKTILERLQTSMVTAQVDDYIEQARQCPRCASALHRKGKHEVVYRTVFGKLRVESPRLYRCRGCDGDGGSFSPLAEQLPERSSPELQYLQTQFASLMSYGLTVKVLGEVLPLDQVLAETSTRRWVNRIGPRLKHHLKDERNAATAAFETPHPYIPEPTPVKAVAIDGGYVRLAGRKSRQAGWFEVIVGKSQRDEQPGSCFAYVHRLESDPAARMLTFLNQEHVRPDQPVTFLSDGGDTVRQTQAGYGLFGDFILDWFHVGMRFENLFNLTKGLPEGDGTSTRDEILKHLESAKWHLWHGCPYRALQRLTDLTWDVDALEATDRQKKLADKLDEFINYIDNNQKFITNYGDRYRYGEPIASSVAESAVNQVVSKRFVKKQQMAWSDHNADQLLQVRTAQLNDDLRRCFERWFPSMAANDNQCELAA